MPTSKPFALISPVAVIAPLDIVSIFVKLRLDEIISVPFIETLPPTSQVCDRLPAPLLIPSLPVSIVKAVESASWSYISNASAFHDCPL